jgi:ribosome biogenesis GTPase A
MMKFKGTNMEPYWDLVNRIIKESDIVLEILDARVVDFSRNFEIERLILENNRPILFVINKSDLVSKEKIKQDVEKLKSIGAVVFISAKKPRTTKVLLYNIRKVFKKHGKRPESEKDKSNSKNMKFREAKADIVVGVLGYPNVGKSSIINALCHKKKLAVSKKAGTTHGMHWIRATKDIKLIDSPGVIPLGKDDDLRYGLIGANGEETLKHPDIVAHAIIELFMKSNKKRFEEFYNINLEKENSYDVVNTIALRRRFLLKAGELDENKTCQLIIRDWQEGKLRL